MSKTILQINYQFTSSLTDFTAMVTPLAEPISGVPGLVWKIWLMNEAAKEAGGIYLFESRDAAQAFVNSQGVKDFASHPMISAVSAKMFDPDESLSKVTRGPITMAVPA